MRYRSGLFWIVAMLAWASPALAQPFGDSREEDEAKAQFQLGRDAFKKHEFARALALFSRSQELHPRPGTLLNLASCEEEIGLLASALKHYRELLTQFPENDTRASLAKTRIAALDPRVPRLRINLAPGSPSDTAVTLDGAKLDSSQIGTELRVEAGAHVIATTVSGQSARSFTITLAEGQVATVIGNPGDGEAGRVVSESVNGPASEGPRNSGASGAAATSGEPAARMAPVSRASSGERTAGYLIGGIGLAGFAVGTITGGLAITKKGEFDDLCPSRSACSVEGVELEASAKALATMSTVWFAASLVWTGAGAYLVLSNRDEPANGDTSRSARGTGGGAGEGRKSDLAITPWIGVASAGVRGTF